ncbi:aldo/keto reductase [Leucobacter sp. GX24907]
MTNLPHFTAHNGFKLPAMGFGTVRLLGDEGADVIAQAIKAGYRLIDTASGYENEGSVGEGLRRSGVDRSEITVTSKLPSRHHASPQNRHSIEESRARLGVDAIDLHLIHWPVPRLDRYVEAWEAMVAARERGVVRQIGVSNFLPEHLERIEQATGVRPVVNQIELHPYFPQAEALAAHRELGILTEAWSPLGKGKDLLAEAVVLEIARNHDASPAQVVLAWHIVREVIAIPRSRSFAHQRANLEAADIVLDPAEVDAITALGRADGRLLSQHPNTYEEF